MKDFVFQQFAIQQSKEVFRVGTDGVLLGALVNLQNAQNILEVGTGTGLISLMMAQRNSSAKILALDINEEAVGVSQTNFNNSPFNERLTSQLIDYKEFNINIQFDLIACNPPYFEENASSKDVFARQKVMLDFNNLIEKSAQLITNNGLFSVIIPSQDADDFIEISEKFDLHLVRKINIFGIEGGVLKRNILEFSKTKINCKILDFIIEKSPRKYSDQYLELTKEFHIFKK